MFYRIIPVFLLTAACGNSFDADGLDLPLDSIAASFVETGTYTADTNDDGEPDITMDGIGVVLTDREDLCSALSGTTVDELSDVFAVQVLALSVEGPDLLETNGSLLSTFFDPSPGDVFVAVRAIERSGGVTVGHYMTQNLIDPEAISTSELWISSRSMSNGEVRSLGGSFKATLRADRTDEASFDTDFDDDGTDDYQSIDVDAKGKIASADPCDNLNVLP
jgi:hypothetical protein